MPVPTEIQQQRLDMCKGCEHYKPMLSKCDKCGCIMKLKTRLIGAKCPVQKWNAYRKP